MYRHRWIWFISILGGAIAWSIHLVISYGISEAACEIENSLFYFMGFTSAGWWLIITTLLCLSLSIASTVISYNRHKVAETEDPFISTFGIYVNLIFTLAILAQSMPIFTLLGDC